MGKLFGVGIVFLASAFILPGCGKQAARKAATLAPLLEEAESAEARARCPLTAAGKAVIEDSISRRIGEAKWIVSETHGRGMFATRAFAASLLGSADNFIGRISLAETCEEPKTYDPFCDPSPLSGKAKKCIQLRCMDGGVVALHVWWKLQGKLQYRSEAPPTQGFLVSYSGQPKTEIRFDTRSSSQIRISWKSQDTAQADFRKEKLNIQSRVDASGTLDGNGPAGANLVLTFPSLSNASPVQAKIRINRHGQVSGDVSIGNRIVGSLAGHDDHSEIEWNSVCK